MADIEWGDVAEASERADPERLLSDMVRALEPVKRERLESVLAATLSSEDYAAVMVILEPHLQEIHKRYRLAVNRAVRDVLDPLGDMLKLRPTSKDEFDAMHKVRRERERRNG